MAPPALVRRAFTPGLQLLAEPCGHANGAEREMHDDAGGKACTSQLPATAAGEPPSIEAEAPPCTVRGVGERESCRAPIVATARLRTWHPDPGCHPLPRQRVAAVLLSGADRRGRGLTVPEL